jgi:transposase-like protein
MLWQIDCMKTKQPEKDLTLIQLFDRFGTDDKARKHLESVLWKDGIVCPHCKCNDQKKFSEITPNPATKTRAGLRFCGACRRPFTVTIGTIFEDSHLPLRKWLIAWYLLCSSKKGISSLQLKRILEIGSYGTALFMTHRIRFALKDNGFASKLSGTVEADETFVGGFTKGQGRGYSGNNKVPVVSLVQRGGNVRSQVMTTISASNLRKAIRENVEAASQLHTDRNPAYVNLKNEYDHRAVKHGAGEFSRREGEVLVTTSSVESYFSLLKRGVTGTFHHISPQYLPLYLAEFDHRHNCRKMTDGVRTDIGLQKAAGKRLIGFPASNLIAHPC